MKKFLFILIMFITLLSFKVDALEYYNIEVNTLFEESIEFSEIPSIELRFYVFNPSREDDIGDLKEYYELTKENNYSTIIKDTFITDNITLDALVKDDSLGLFDCKVEFTTPVEGVANINIMVTRNNYQKNDVKISKHLLSKVYGMKTTSSSTNTTSTTVNIEEINKKEENQQKREEKKQKNNQITNILFITIGIIIVIGVIFVTIKFVNSNK